MYLECFRSKDGSSSSLTYLTVKLIGDHGISAIKAKDSCLFHQDNMQSTYYSAALAMTQIN